VRSRALRLHDKDNTHSILDYKILTEYGDGRVMGDGRVEYGDGCVTGDGRVEYGDGRVEYGDGRVTGDGRVEYGDGRELGEVCVKLEVLPSIENSFNSFNLMALSRVLDTTRRAVLPVLSLISALAPCLRSKRTTSAVP